MRILMLQVPNIQSQEITELTRIRGLDNAGKTTIVKKIMNEDVNTVSPTLGFIIKTIDYEGWVIMDFTTMRKPARANGIPGTN